MEQGSSPASQRGDGTADSSAEKSLSIEDGGVLSILSQADDEMEHTQVSQNLPDEIKEAKPSDPMEVECDGLGPEEQVMTFKSKDELVNHIGNILQLPVVALAGQSDLDGCYIGGKIIAHTQDSLSQGGDLSVLIKDSSTPLLLTVNIRGELADKVPSLVAGPEIFFYNASVESMESDEFSQDCSKCLVAEGDSCLVWIVSKPGKAPAAPGKKWWKKHKKRVRAMKQANIAAVQTEGGQTSAAEKKQVNATALRDQPSTSGHDINSRRKSIDATFPDNCDIPDSAFATYSTPYVNSDSSGSEEEPLPSSSSSDSSDTEVPRKKPKVGNTGRKYQYKKISELHPGDKKVNVFGVAQDFSSPTSTRGADYSSTVVLVDESCPRDGVKGIFFNRHEYKLPQVKQIGDIVCLHRINVEPHLDSLRIDGTPWSSSMCFDGRISSSLKPRTGAISYTLTDEDKQRVQELREWGTRQQSTLVKKFTKLEQVIPDSRFNLLCQVVSTSRCSLPSCCVLTVWDGTQLPMKLRAYDENLLRPLADPLLPQSHTSGGLKIHVVVSNKECFPTVNALKSGDYVLLQNVHASARYCINRYRKRVPIIEFALETVNGENSNSMIQTLRDDSLLIAELSRTLTSFVEPRPVRYPPVSQVTTTTVMSQSANPVPLSALTQSSGGGETQLCRAKVMSVRPSVEKLVNLLCPHCLTVFLLSPQLQVDAAGVCLHPCAKCLAKKVKTVKKPYCYYSIEMQVEDETAKLKVYSRGDDAVKLLNNLLPRNLYQDKHSRRVLLNKLFLLTGGQDPFDATGGDFYQRPWIDLCISPKPVSQGTIYLVVDTVIKADAKCT